MTTIDQLLDALLLVEGGYSNNPADKGGPTNFGITEQVARAYGYAGDMRALPRDTAKAIYRAQYWTRPGFDKVAARMPQLAVELFDTGVNMGPRAAAKMLQRCLNVFNRQQADYPDIVADGDLGPMSFAALDRLALKRGLAAAESTLRRGVDSLQGARYIEIAEHDPTQEAFAFGWIDKRTD